MLGGLEFIGGRLEFVLQAFWGSSKLSNCGLAIPWLIKLFRIYSFT